jgi:two-component system sensor histidine kinase PilS (NtrC family)
MEDPAHSWFDPAVLETIPQAREETQEFVRLWQAFMTARLGLGFILLVLQATLYATGSTHSKVLLGICIAYLASAWGARWLGKPRRLGKSFNRTWLILVGLDVGAFLALQLLQGNSLNYTPLFALPILLTAVLGSLRLALGTAAGITVALLGATLWMYFEGPMDPTPYFVQAALSGVGYFAIALLANQLSTRLASEGARALSHQLAVRIQRQVNELVIESLPDGVLIVDERGSVRAANPAARQMLGSQRALHAAVFDLATEPGWQPLQEIARIGMGAGVSLERDVTIYHGTEGPRRLRVRSRLATSQDVGGEALCVLFLQDQRELEARMRTEKLASMGRMSTAVAHEIRNPLAAIAQANALLAEDISDPRLTKLTDMVGQNALRLEKIVNDILNVSRVQPNNITDMSPAIELNAAVRRYCFDWATQNRMETSLSVEILSSVNMVQFDSEHLRRVMVNLLDNAKRHSTGTASAIQVRTAVSKQGLPQLQVWSDGPPLEQSVQRHLFEPFFSSESRSSGLGLYICRELCEGHSASIAYQRAYLDSEGQSVQGNEFSITFVGAETARTPVQLDLT